MADGFDALRIFREAVLVEWTREHADAMPLAEAEPGQWVLILDGMYQGVRVFDDRETAEAWSAEFGYALKALGGDDSGAGEPVAEVVGARWEWSESWLFPGLGVA